MVGQPIEADPLLAMTFEHAVVAMALVDADGRTRRVNPAMCALFGYPAERFVGQPLAALIDPDDLAAGRSVGEQADQAAKQRFRTADGRVLWGRSTVLESTAAHGSPRRALVQIQDIIAQVQAESDAIAAASFRRAVFRASPDIISVFDFTTRSAVWQNRTAADMLGYSDEDVASWPAVSADKELSKVGAALVDEQDRESLDRALAQVHQAIDDRVVEVKYRMRHKDGTLHWFSQSMVPLSRDEHGVVDQMVAISRDVTEAQLSDASLRESQARFRQLAESVDVGFTLRSWEPEAFLYVSPGFAKIFGYNPMDVGQLPDQTHERVHADDRERFVREFVVPMKQGQAVQIEYRIIRPDGEMRCVRSKAAPVFGPGGRQNRSATTSEDITVSRQATSAKLAAEAAERASSAKNEFLSRMSHELRTPLNAVMGFAQLLELDDLSADQQISVRHIVRGGRHLVGLIDDILDISKIESDRLEMSLEQVPIYRLLQETAELMAPAAAAARVTVTEVVEPADARPVLADHRRLRQVMLNLLSNAIKYNRRGGRVDISCTRRESGFLDVHVSDTGRGIRVEHLPRLFVPFDRLDAGVTGVDGTGVGLALSHRLMKLMGGDLSATSEFGHGSVFTATIPLTTGPVDPQLDAARWHPPAGEDRSQEPSRTLLYIEDNSSNVELMERLVQRRASWHLLVAGHGALGLELAAANTPDLILLDLHLPDRNGIDLLHQLRSDPKTAHLNVVVVSADANPHQVMRLLAAGARDYLTKPLEVPRVLALLDSPEFAGAKN